MLLLFVSAAIARSLTRLRTCSSTARSDEARANGVWSLRWSPDGREVAAGTADASLLIYDVAAGRVAAAAPAAHDDDVNAVAYADASGVLIYTGSDDAGIKAWDRRLLAAPGAPAARGCVGAHVGHTDGVCHLDARADGRHLLSNSKDQSAKVWDARALRPARAAAAAAADPAVPRFAWDYRWMPFPARGRVVQHPHDSSLTTLRGHTVLETLVRAYWSPLHSTGQRYVYAGSADGAAVVYDVTSARPVARLRGASRECVRDLSWHPHEPLIVTASFDGALRAWAPAPGAGEAAANAEEAAAAAARAAALPPGRREMCWSAGL